MHNSVLHNFDLEVRQIVADTTGVTIDSVYSDTALKSLFDGDDDTAYFWRAIESKFNWMASQAQQENLSTVGAIVRELKLRARVEANG